MANRLLTVAGVAEVAVGVTVVLAPTLVGRLLLGAEPIGVGAAAIRFTGVALTALGIGSAGGSAWLTMWSYTTLVALFLAYLGAATPWHGPLLWPAVAGHVALSVAMLLPLGRGGKALRH